MIQIVDHTKKTVTYRDSTPILITSGMTMSKQGFHTPEKTLQEWGYTMLRQMGYDDPYNQKQPLKQA